MESFILDFLKNNRISVLGLQQPEGNLHAASLHYSHSENPFSFYFITEKESRKCRGLLDNQEHPASLVVGFSEEEFKTFQAEGKAKIIADANEFEEAWKVYLSKYPNSEKRKNDPEFVIIKFTPDYWSYRDYKTSPMTLVTSNK